MGKVLIAALFGVITAFIIEFGGDIEGQVAPVMGPLELTEPADLSNGDTVWAGRAKKLRGCSYVRTEWFLGPRNGRRVQVHMEYTDPPEVRTEGVLTWAGIIINLSIRQVLENSHADVLHKCPNRPWLTRTPFYDSEASE